MTELRLIEGAVESAGPSPREADADAGAGDDAGAERLPRGRHGIPADLVRSHQRERLLEAATGALAEGGYGRVTATRLTELAHVSSRTFYQHFEDLWACLLAAYETEAAHLRREIEGACKTAGEEPGAEAGSAEEPALAKRHDGDDASGRHEAPAKAGVDAALSFLASNPGVARLLCAEPPPQISALAAARRDLAETLAEMLRNALAAADPTPLPGLEHRLVAAAMALVATRAASGEESRLRELDPELRDLLLASL